MPTTVHVTPDSVTFTHSSDTVQLNVTVKDQNGQPMTSVAVFWSSEDSSVARVNARGVVTPVSNGMTTVLAKVGELGGLATVTVEFTQRAVLLQTYDELGGYGWSSSTNWGTDEPLDTWYGV